jgi:hypothetical protein
MRRHGKEPFPVIYQDSKPDSESAKSGMLRHVKNQGIKFNQILVSGKLYEPVAKAQLKKMTKLWQQVKLAFFHPKKKH